MNVKELKELIFDLPDDMQVILQKDSEGNGYSPLAGTDSNAVYIAENSYSGEVYSLNWSSGDASMSEDDWLEIKKTDPALILYPIN